MPSRTRTILAPCLAILCSGCALVDLIDGDPEATVGFFATHAGTFDDEGYPNLGDSETTRVFVTDQGYQVSLSEAYVTTAEVRFVACGEPSGTAIEMFWGPCPEDFVGADDLNSVPLGAVNVTEGAYCAVDVEFGPFVRPPGGDEHIAVGNPMIQDNTIVIVGVARRGEPPMLEEYPFEIVSDAVLTARVDISKLEDGGPFTLEDENFTRDLTIIKTYDTFFDGVDFASASPADIETAVLAALENDTRAYDGTFDNN